jgi:hypothetical protein
MGGKECIGRPNRDKAVMMMLFIDTETLVTQLENER